MITKKTVSIIKKVLLSIFYGIAVSLIVLGFIRLVQAQEHLSSAQTESELDLKIGIYENFPLIYTSIHIF